MEGTTSRKVKPRPGPLLPPEDSNEGTTRVPIDNKAEKKGYGTFSGTAGEKTGQRDLTLWEYVSSPNSPLRMHIQEHCQHQWIAVVISIALLLLILYIVAVPSNPQTPSSCVTKFGTYLGKSRGISAYSNCQHLYFSNVMPHYISVGLDKRYTGNKWLSLEYARRYWIIANWLSLPVLDTPFQLTKATSAHNVNSRLRVSTPLVHYYNLPLSDYKRELGIDEDVGKSVNLNNVPMKEWIVNRTKAMLQEGDLIVYSKNKKTLPHGHVAVVVGVTGPFTDFEDLDPSVRKIFTRNVSSWAPLSPEKKKIEVAHNSAPEEESGEGKRERYYQIYVAEQNWNNEPWVDAGEGEEGNQTRSKERNYSRILLLRVLHPSVHYFLQDTHHNEIVEWIRPSPDHAK